MREDKEVSVIAGCESPSDMGVGSHLQGIYRRTSSGVAPAAGKTAAKTQTDRDSRFKGDVRHRITWGDATGNRDFS